MQTEMLRPPGICQVCTQAGNFKCANEECVYGCLSKSGPYPLTSLPLSGFMTLLYGSLGCCEQKPLQTEGALGLPVIQ